MKTPQLTSKIKLEAKRQTELWIYSFADMYMILSVFFIALAVLYAAKVRQQKPERPPVVASAGRGPSAVTSSLAIYFPVGKDRILQDAESDLSVMLPVLQSSRGYIDIEGYADGSPLAEGSRFRSQLDLSNQRAVRVAEWLMKKGVDSSRIRTFSYGDSQIFKTDDEGTKSNRRVVIKISPMEGRR